MRATRILRDQRAGVDDRPEPVAVVAHVRDTNAV